jgi:Domain of unknown function (DUF4034)
MQPPIEPQGPSGGPHPRFASDLRAGIIILLILVLIAVCASRLLDPIGVLSRWLVAAATSPDTQQLQWLQSGDYQAIDHHYSSLQLAFEHGELTDSQLYGEFRKLYQDNPDNSRYFDRWVQAYPSSYAARVAQGAYYYRMAWAARGHDYIQDTSPLRLYLMELYLDKATAILRQSLQLSPRPYLSSLYLLNIAMMHGARAEARHWLTVGTSLDPNASLIRLRYLVALQPRWGGSLDEMRAYIAECEREHLTDQTLARLKWSLAQEEIYDMPQNTSVERRIALFTDLALEARAAGAAPPPMALAALARIYWDQHRRADADRLLAQLDTARIEDAWALEQMGYVYMQEQKMSAGWPALLKSAQLGDSWSEFIVGKTLINGCADIHLAPNRATGLRWLERAANQGFGAAAAYLAHSQ